MKKLEGPASLLYNPPESPGKTDSKRPPDPPSHQPPTFLSSSPAYAPSRLEGIEAVGLGALDSSIALIPGDPENKHIALVVIL